MAGQLQAEQVFKDDGHDEKVAGPHESMEGASLHLANVQVHANGHDYAKVAVAEVGAEERGEDAEPGEAARWDIVGHAQCQQDGEDEQRDEVGEQLKHRQTGPQHNLIQRKHLIIGNFISTVGPAGSQQALSKTRECAAPSSCVCGSESHPRRSTGGDRLEEEIWDYYVITGMVESRSE